MKKFLGACCCVLLLLQSSAQNITAAEYFFDADPGFGAGTPVVVGTPGFSVSFTASISTALLSPGFHVLAVRTKNAAGVWSLSESRAVYISSSTTGMPAINAAEYFIDADPGGGDGTPLSVGTAGNAVNFTALIPTTSLISGFHILAIRTRDANGLWSFFETRPFYISATAGNAPSITAAEYFIDADPGAGSGTPVNPGAPGAAATFAFSIPTTSLATGFHVLALRVKDASGTWSLFETRPFYISPTASNMTALAGGEYFIDSDPGIGNGEPFTFSSPANNVSQIVQMRIPSGTAPGQHLLVARVKDQNGIWSLFDTVRTVTVGGALPLDFLSFTAKRKETSVLAEWVTENEVNTSHFEVERSGNGVGFSKISDVVARNAAGRHNYLFEDAAPLKGLNFYRLKQVDQNGRSRYSTIVKLFFGDRGTNDLRLFPQPVQSVLNVSFGGSGNKLFVQVYDASGKMVINERRQNSTTFAVETTTLAKGSYWVVVSDGVTQQKGQFVKQ